VRPGNLFSNRGSAVLDAPEPGRAAREMRAAGLKRGAPVTEMPLRRAGYDPDEYSDETDMGFDARKRRVRVSFQAALLPTSLWGRIALGCALLLMAAGTIVAGLAVRRFLLRDARFTVPNAGAIEIGGNSHLTRAQLLSIFGEDVDRNIFTIPLNERRAELGRLPWVERATVMRLLPNRIRVAIVERTPVAFVRQGGQIGLVDASGALFDLPGPEMDAANGGRVPHYSFPVLTGISEADPLSTRGARMRIYLGFVAALDAGGENISRKLSEVDLSSPEDVKAVIPDAGGSGVLVHFGEERFLERYHAYQQHLVEWRAQYPRLASADMRYERQVVLGMKPDALATAPAAADAKLTPISAKSAAPAAAAAKSSPAPVNAALATSNATAVAHPAQTKKPAAHPTIRARRWRPAAKRSATKRPVAHAARPVVHAPVQGAAR
jgi:cell division protein FtsQ